jgi:hypothetical protein
MRIACCGVAACCILIVATSMAAIAAPPSSSTPAYKHPPAGAAASVPQMRAYIDPETGQLIDHPVTEEQKRAARQGTNAPGAGVVQTFHHADGSIEVVLNGAADSELIATVGKDGKVKMECTDNSHKLPLQNIKPQQPEASDER